MRRERSDSVDRRCEKMTRPTNASRAEIEKVIHEWIIGRNGERDRRILARCLFDGITYERLAEEFELSVSQVKRILYNGMNVILRHL
jgi:DNA-directed RNA polymerase specialized sigma24 family protein